jgi:serine/threonine protein kinase
LPKAAPPPRPTHAAPPTPAARTAPAAVPAKAAPSKTHSEPVAPKTAPLTAGAPPAGSGPVRNAPYSSTGWITLGASPTGSGAAPAPAVAGVGQTIGKCLLTERVGEGGSGIVFRALHQGFNIPVAVKLLRLNAEGVVAVRLGHEAQLLARLNHPNIVRVWDFDDAATPPYLVLEWVDGLSLEDLIRQSGRMSVPRAVRVVGQVAAALAEAHKVGIVHRDVKPANILLTRDGTAKLADLGLALMADPRGPGGQSAVSRASIAGTISHMAPELFSGRPPDQYSDMYALGVTFYQALTGEPPFPGPTRAQFMIQHAEDKPVPPHELCSDIPPPVSLAAVRMLEKEPEARFPSFGEVIAALERAERPGADGPRTPPTSGPPPGLRTDPAPVTAVAPPPPPPPPAPKPRRSLWKSLFGGKPGGTEAGGDAT